MKKTLLLFILLLATTTFGLEINEPTGSYTSKMIPLNFTHENATTFSYSINSATFVQACTNCSEYIDVIEVPYGNHTIVVRIEDVNISQNTTSEFSVEYPQPEIDINEPIEKTYYDNTIFVNVTGNLLFDSITYMIDNSTTTACENCSDFNLAVDVDEGHHVLVVEGHFEDISTSDSVNFTVELPEQDFTLTVHQPKATTYNENITIHVTTNTTVDILHVKIGSLDWSCDDCSTLSDNISLTPGTYTLIANALLNDTSKQKIVVFTIRTPQNNSDDDDDEYEPDAGNKTSRFTQDLNKLPQIVLAGDLTDEELAQIIMDNKLNPGVINRLIKTGMLGNESIEAILDTQFKPQGIFQKLLSIIGLGGKGYAQEIYEHYNLTSQQQKKIVARPDLPKKYQQEVKEQLEIKTQIETQQRVQVNKPVVVGKQEKTSPGLAKKADIDTSQQNAHGKSNNGKSEKNKNGNSKNGKSK